MASSLNVTALPEYVNEHKDELFVKASLGAKTLDYVEIMPNVKHKDALNYLDSTVVLADGSACGWNPQGSDVFSQRFIEVHPVEVNKDFCWKDLIETYANHQLRFEAGRETLPFEQKLAESNMNAIKDAVEVLAWNGSESLGITGFLADIKAEEDVAKIDEVAKGSTATAAIDAAVALISSRALAKGVNLFMSYTNFRKYVGEQNANCCAGRPVIDAASESIKYSGDSRITIVPVMGLEGTDAFVAAPADALVYATDIEGAHNVYKMGFDDKTDLTYFKVLFASGTALKYPDEVVLVTIAE